MVTTRRPSDETPSFTDFVQPFLIDRSAIRGRLVRMELAVDEIVRLHNYPHAASLHFAEQLVLAALLSATLSEGGILTVQAKGEGPMTFMIADVIAGGTIRGCAGFREGGEGELGDEPRALGGVLGGGYLAVTLDPGEGQERYQGIVELAPDSLAETFRGYFRQSQQAEVALHVAVRPPERKGEKWRAGGIIIERMPVEGGNEGASLEEQNELWERTRMFMQTLKDSELLDHDVTPQNLLYRLFNEDGVWVYKLQPIKAGCRCSRERVKAALASIEPEELLEMLDDGRLTIHCQFCNTRRSFTEADIRKLHAPAKKKAAPAKKPAGKKAPAAKPEARKPAAKKPAVKKPPEKGK